MSQSNNSNTFYTHKITLDVRDYECDIADGVNNLVYMSYLEYTRHSMLKAGGINLAALTRQRIGLVISRAEIDFLRSLMNGDKFVIKSFIRLAPRLRFEFNPNIYRLPDNGLILKAKILFDLKVISEVRALMRNSEDTSNRNRTNEIKIAETNTSRKQNYALQRDALIIRIIWL